MKAIAVIPARYASTRLPGKPLLDICGKPMIQRVWDAVSQVHRLDDIIVATDDMRIAKVVEGFGGKVCMTSPDCQSGSDRVREAAEAIDADVFINIQGDEPLLEPSAIEALINVFAEDESVQVATLCSPISEEQARSPHQVKVVRDHVGNALYFSRSLIPFDRDERKNSTHYLGHVGIYAYKSDKLRIFSELAPSPLEKIEKLEQLRFLQSGIPIRVLEIPSFGAGVDTFDDLERVRTVIREQRRSTALRKLKYIRLVITDVDGVLTDGSLFYGPEGESLKCFHARDGYGVKLLHQAGIQVAVLSGRDCPALRRRLEDLGITEAVLGELDKQAALSGILNRCGVTAEEVVYIGDDIQDAKIFQMCGVSVTVSDSSEYIRNKADLILNSCSGNCAFRELADIIMSQHITV